MTLARKLERNNSRFIAIRDKVAAGADGGALSDPPTDTEIAALVDGGNGQIFDSNRSEKVLMYWDSDAPAASTMEIRLYIRSGTKVHPNGVWLKVATISGLAAKTLAAATSIYRAGQCLAVIAGTPAGANPQILAFGIDD
jgi:hypothetical protein